MNTPGYTGGGGGGFGGGKGGGAYPREPREMRLDARGWTSQKLDVGVAIAVFRTWKDRAMMFLSRDRPDVRRLLAWAETQSQETLRNGLAAQAAALNVHDLAGVEYALHDGIKMTLQDTLLGRARGCIEQGCELWRVLCAEWSGTAPQLQAAKARGYTTPATCKTVGELWSRLPAWERLGEEVELSGCTIAPWLAIVALDTLLPTQLRDTLVSCASQGSQLATYAQRLAWVKMQMEHSRGISQAAGYAPHGKDAAGDVNMYSVDEPAGLASDPIASMSWAMAESVQAGDWDLAAQLQDTIYALKGSKGGGRKGLGKGKPGKGGAAPAAAGKGAHTFDGVCNHCGHYGHRLSECRKRDAEVAAGKTGGKKGKAGGKGGPTGGKGPAAATGTLAEVGADDDHWAGDLLDGAIAGAAAEFDEWDFAHAAVCSLRANPATPDACRRSCGRPDLPRKGRLAVAAPRASYATMPGGASASTRLAQPISGSIAEETFSGQTAGASASTRLAQQYKTLSAIIATPISVQEQLRGAQPPHGRRRGAPGSSVGRQRRPSHRGRRRLRGRPLRDAPWLVSRRHGPQRMVTRGPGLPRGQWNGHQEPRPGDRQVRHGRGRPMLHPVPGRRGGAAIAQRCPPDFGRQPRGAWPRQRPSG